MERMETVFRNRVAARVQEPLLKQNPNVIVNDINAMYPPSSGITAAAAAEPGRKNHFDEFV